MECGDAPDGKAAATAQSAGLISSADGFGTGVTSGDGDIIHGQIAVYSQNPGAIQIAPNPFQGNSGRK